MHRVWRFERELAHALPADAVVAHMIPAYVLLAAPIVRPRRTPLLLWYTHWKASTTLRVAERLATAIVSVDRRSFPLASPKVRPIGHGIDVNEFVCTERTRGPESSALVLGRYSPAKGIETILRAVEQVEGVDVRLHGVALNELERRHRSELERLGVPLGDAVPRAQVPELFASSDLLVNNMEAGAPDKVVYEAAAACLPVLASIRCSTSSSTAIRCSSSATRRKASPTSPLVRRARRKRTCRDRANAARACGPAAFGRDVGRWSPGGCAVNQVGTVLHLQKVAGISGSEAHLLSLLPRLKERGWDVRFLMLHEHEPGAWEFARELRARGIPLDSIPLQRTSIRSPSCGLPAISRADSRGSSTRISCTPTSTGSSRER